MIYHIGDPHWGHERIIELCNRPFETVDEMNLKLINNWNNTVTNYDTVYVHGDVFLCPTEQMIMISQILRGKKIFIRRNHDGQSRTKIVERMGFEDVQDKIIIKDLILSHYRLEDDEIPDGLLNVHAHTHNTKENDDKHFCVSVEMIGYKPISQLEIIKYHKSIHEMGA